MGSKNNSKSLLLIYKNRYLIIYIIIGFMSLILEQIVTEFSFIYIQNSFLNNALGFITGVFFAFIFNAKFNFKVPQSRLLKSMAYFFIISFLSLVTQTLFKNLFEINASFDRYVISGSMFFFFYLLHRKISFESRKKVGLAIHLNDSQDIDKIYERVGDYPDFIHVDLIDDSMNSHNISTDLTILNKIINLWPGKNIQLHLMSQNHSFWISKLKTYSDKLKIFIHDDQGNKISNLQNEFENFDISLVITEQSSINESILENLSEIICLCIDKPGFSGQTFQENMDKVIEEYIILKKRYDFEITLDGGITEKIATKFDVENFVSASYVLNSENSRKKIVDLQTANKYQQ